MVEILQNTSKVIRTYGILSGLAVRESKGASLNFPKNVWKWKRRSKICDLLLLCQHRRDRLITPSFYLNMLYIFLVNRYIKVKFFSNFMLTLTSLLSSPNI